MNFPWNVLSLVMFSRYASTYHISFLLLGHPVPAVQHLLAAKYLVELMGGPRHPELVTLLFRLVNIYDEIGDYETAQKCLEKAKKITANVAKQCMISATIAETHGKMGNLALAVTEQRGVLRIMEQLYGNDDERTVEAKGRVEIFLRKLTVDKVNAARETFALRDFEDAQRKAGTIKSVGKVQNKDGKVHVKGKEGKGKTSEVKGSEVKGSVGVKEVKDVEVAKEVEEVKEGVEGEEEKKKKKKSGSKKSKK